MDADRRGKTVIAGTFAIERKSVSNSRPISAGETQRPKAEMTMASTHVPTLHEAGARTHDRRGGGRPSLENPPAGPGRAKLVDRRSSSPFDLSISHFFFSETAANFCNRLTAQGSSP
jgi:hypothetical protein